VLHDGFLESLKRPILSLFPCTAATQARVCCVIVHSIRCMMRFQILALAACLALAVTSTQAAPEVSVARAMVDGHAEFSIRAEVRVRASIARTWQVLTDYDRLASFVPDLQSSVRLPWPGAPAGYNLVEQHAVARLLFLRQPITLVLQVREKPMSVIDMTLQSGNMRKYDARWELLPDAVHAVLLRYSGTLSPDFYVPGLFATTLMHRDLAAMLTAVAAEIEKGVPDDASHHD